MDGLTIQEMAFDHSQHRMDQLIQLAMEKGMSVPDLLILWAGLIGDADPRLARLSLEAMEETINASNGRVSVNG